MIEDRYWFRMSVRIPVHGVFRYIPERLNSFSVSFGDFARWTLANSPHHFQCKSDRFLTSAKRDLLAIDAKHDQKMENS